MNSFKIACADSGVGNGNGTFARYDALYNSVECCAYIRPAYLSSRYDSFSPLGGGLFSGWTFIALAFAGVDVAFLQTKRLISCRLWINVLSAVPAKQNIIAFCPTSASFKAGATSGACAFTAGNGADVLTEIDVGKLDGWKGFEISSLAVLKNVLMRGVKIESLGAGADSMAQFSAQPVSHPSLAPYIEVEYEDEYSPPVCGAMQPAATVVDADLPVEFCWSYQQAVNAPQSHVTVRVRKTGGNWQEIASKKPHSAQRLSAVLSTALRGECQWQVQVFCTAGAVASDFSEIKSFLCAGAPAAPAITDVVNAAICTITWQQDVQAGFEVFMYSLESNKMIYSSGQRLSTDKNFTFPFVLEDGSYSVEIRSLNKEGRWGPFASVGINVKNKGFGNIDATAVAQANSLVRIEWKSEKKFESFEVLKNGKVLARLGHDENSYSDRLAIGICRYCVRGILGREYVVSGTCVARVLPKYALIGGIKNGEFIELEMRQDKPPMHRQERRANCVFVQYESARLPAAYVGVGQKRKHELLFSLESQQNCEDLFELVGQGIIYKDCEGQMFCGVLEAVSAQSGSGFDVQITITEAVMRGAEKNASGF